MQITNMQQKDALQTFVLTALYGLFFYLFVFFLHKIDILNVLPDTINLKNWDAGIYLDIADKGYHYEHPRYNNIGWYALFPLLCYILQSNIWLICSANILLFAAGFTILSALYPSTLKHKLVWLTTPVLYFMFVPYSEALFFFFMSLTFYGIKEDKKWVIIFAVFMASLTRATAIFLLPSFLVMELLSSEKDKLGKALYRYLFYYVTPILVALLLFTWYQYRTTHVWGAYFVNQQQYQGHVFSWPKLPFSNHENNRNLWYNTLTSIIDFVALITLCYYILRWIIKKEIVKDKGLILSLSYLAMTLIVITFFNPKWGTGTTSIRGLSRWSLCTPFFFIVYHHFFVAKEAYRPAHYLAMFLLSNLVWLSYGSYIHIVAVLYYNFCFVFVFGYMMLANKRQEWPALVIVMLNVLIQVFLFSEFVNQLFPD